MRKFILVLVFLFAIVVLAITVSADDTGWLTSSSEGDCKSDWQSVETDGGGDAMNWGIGFPVADENSFYDYSFNIPSGSNIDGIEVKVYGRTHSSSHSGSLTIKMSPDACSSYSSGISKSWSYNSGNNYNQIYGSSTEDWGRSWSVSEFSDDNFRLYGQVSGFGTYEILDVEQMWVKVYYSASNSAPTQTNASPNGSSIHTVDNFTIDLSDGDDDSLTWQMWTNYSGTWTMFDNGTGNGTQTSTNTSWLPCEGTVYWSVNVTDGTEWTNTTYSFTITNDPPTFSNIDPADGSTTTGLNCSIKLTIEDPDGDTFSYNWSCSDGSYNLATGNTNGTKYLMLCMEGIHTCGTTYTWWINASDGCEYTNNSYSFTTRPCVMNYSDIHPSNASSNICPCTLCNNNTCVCINATHETGNNVNISFYSNYSGTWQLFENYSNVSGRYCAFFPASYNTTYWWYVNVTEFNNESSYNQTDVYHFTTAENYSNCTCSASSGEIIFTDIDNAYILTIILIVGGLGIIFADTRRKRGK